MGDSRYDEIAKLETLHAEHPEGRVFTHLAEAYRRAGELERAREVLESGLWRHEDYASAHVVHGRILLDEGRSEEAAAAFRRVLELDSQNLVALRALGDIHRAAGRRDEAMATYRDMLALDPANNEVRAFLAALESAAEEPAAAAAAMAPEERPAGVEATGMEGEAPAAPAAEAAAAEDAETVDEAERKAEPPDEPAVAEEPVAEEPRAWSPEDEPPEPVGWGEEASEEAVAEAAAPEGWQPEDEPPEPVDWGEEVSEEPVAEAAAPEGWQSEDEPPEPVGWGEEVSEEAVAEAAAPEGWQPEDEPTEPVDWGEEVSEEPVAEAAAPEGWQPEDEPPEPEWGEEPVEETASGWEPDPSIPPEWELGAESEPEEPPVPGAEAEAGAEVTPSGEVSPFAPGSEADLAREEVDALFGDPLGSDAADAGVEFMDGELVTETIADLYAQQGLLDRALDLYGRLLAERPGDERIQEKLEAVRRSREIEAEGSWGPTAEAAAETPEAAEPVTEDVFTGAEIGDTAEGVEDLAAAAPGPFEGETPDDEEWAPVEAGEEPDGPAAEAWAAPLEAAGEPGAVSDEEDGVSDEEDEAAEGVESFLTGGAGPQDAGVSPYGWEEDASGAGGQGGEVVAETAIVEYFGRLLAWRPAGGAEPSGPDGEGSPDAGAGEGHTGEEGGGAGPGDGES